MVVGVLLVSGCSAVRGVGLGPSGTDGAGASDGATGTGSSSPGPVSEQQVPGPSDASLGGVTGAPTGATLPGAGVVRLGLAAHGGTVKLQVGQQLVVTLGPSWTAPQAQTLASDAGAMLQPLRTDSATGFPASGTAATTFTAVRVGQAVVTAHTDAGCLHTSPRCAPPQTGFEVSVQVQPPPGQGGGALPMSPST